MFTRPLGVFSNGWSSLQSMFSAPQDPSATLLAELLAECNTQIDTYLGEMQVILQALQQCRQEIKAANSQLLHALGAATESSVHAQVVPALESRDSVVSQEISDQLFELLSTYPSFPEEITLETIREFHDMNEKHHKQVFTLVECYLPITYSLINDSKNDLRTYQTI